MTAPNRQRRHDRLTFGAQSTKPQIECDFALGPLDRVATDMDKIWGVDRLVELMTPAIAAKYGARMHELNAAIDAGDPQATAALVAVLIANLHRMDQIAREAGHQPLIPTLWEFELDGQHCAILREPGDWAAAKAQRPGIRTYTMLEVANALRHYGGMVAAVKDSFPGAVVTAVRDKSRPINPDDSLEDVLEDFPDALPF